MPEIKCTQTPTPVSYTRHISRSLMLWLLTLPACSVGAGCPWWITGEFISFDFRMYVQLV